MLNIITKYMTNNDCFKDNKPLAPAGITIHSTAEPGMRAGVWYELWNKPASEQNGREVCVHAFMDDEIVMQYLPWDMRGWHAGGSDNNTHIGIELCEPAGMIYADDFDITGYDAARFQPYFDRIWQNAIELCCYLIKMYPAISISEITSHHEGCLRGTASAHHDPEHWWKLHGKSMDDFRMAIKARLEDE